MGRPPGVLKKTVYKKAASAPASQPTNKTEKKPAPRVPHPVPYIKGYKRKSTSAAVKIRKEAAKKEAGSHKPGRPKGSKTQRLPCGCPRSCRSCTHNNCR